MQLFYYQLVLIVQRKTSVLATPVMSSNLRNQTLLFMELPFYRAPISKVP